MNNAGVDLSVSEAYLLDTGSDVLANHFRLHFVTESCDSVGCSSDGNEKKTRTKSRLSDNVDKKEGAKEGKKHRATYHVASRKRRSVDETDDQEERDSSQEEVGGEDAIDETGK